MRLTFDSLTERALSFCFLKVKCAIQNRSSVLIIHYSGSRKQGDAVEASLRCVENNVHLKIYIYIFILPLVNSDSPKFHLSFPAIPRGFPHDLFSFLQFGVQKCSTWDLVFPDLTKGVVQDFLWPKNYILPIETYILKV